MYEISEQLLKNTLTVLSSAQFNGVNIEGAKLLVNTLIQLESAKKISKEKDKK